MTNTEKLVRRFGSRQGYRIADYAEVALPVYVMGVRALTLAHKRLPPLEEAVLRCIAAGLCDRHEMAAFLGLEESTLRATFVGLAQSEQIALTAAEGRQRWQLTAKGQAAVETLTLITAEERTFTIHFDAVTWSPKLYRYGQLLKNSQLAGHGLRPIELLPPRRPLISDVKARNVEETVESIRPLYMARRDILSILGIQNLRKRYVQAIAILYKAWTNEEYQIAFVVEGSLSRDHEKKFSSTEAYRELSSEWIESAAVDGELRDALGAAQESETGTSIAEIKEATDHLAAEIISRENTDIETQASALETMKAEYERLISELKKPPVRYIYVADHPPLLLDALEHARERLMIISPWVRSVVVDADFVAKLRGLLERGVTVFIGYGMNEEPTQDLKPMDEAARKKLEQLSNSYDNFTYKRLGNTHAKVLIKDRDFAAVTSFNWLSFRGDPKKKFRDEQGALFQNADLVEEKWADLSPRFS